MTKRGWGLATAAVLLLSTVTAGVSTNAAAAPESSDELALVRVQLPTESMFDELVANGFAVAARPDRLVADLVLTGRQLDELTARGVRTVQVIQREGDGTARAAQSQRASQRVAADTLHF